MAYNSYSIISILIGPVGVGLIWLWKRITGRDHLWKRITGRD
jgi:hypothetical protein